jgi:hypothetical protein
MDIIITIGAYITAIGTIIGAINKILDNKLKTVYKVIDEHEETIDDRDRKKIRFQIVSFSASLHHGEKHTREEFEAIFELINIYENIINKRNLTNNYFEEELKYIKKSYESLDKVANM